MARVKVCKILQTMKEDSTHNIIKNTISYSSFLQFTFSKLSELNSKLL